MMRPNVTCSVCHTRSPFGAFVSASETRRRFRRARSGVNLDIHLARTRWIPGFTRLLRTARARSADLVGPVEGVGEVAVLDADQLLAQAGGDRAGGAVADQPLGGLAADAAHRGDHGRGAAGE